MEDIKVIDKCSFCGETKEVIPMKDGQKLICAECLIDLQDRLEGYFLPATNRENIKDNRLCQTNAAVAIAL
jgi:hypothetical protein